MGTYRDLEGKIILPNQNIFRMMRDSYGVMAAHARGYKKIFESSVTIFPVEIRLKYKKEDIDKRVVNISGIPTLRHRKKLTNWSLEFEVLLRESVNLSANRFFSILQFAGEFIGLCDGRTIGFGRFEIFKEKDK